VDQNTKQKGTIHVVRDVTERSLAEEKYKLLFEQMQEGVFATTPDGKLLDCNDALVRMLGYNSRTELMGLNVDAEMYGSPERREAFRREVEQHNYVRNFEVTLRRKDGTFLAALESSFATRGADGKIERYQGFLLDITEKKRAEDEIRRRNRELNALNAMAVIATQSFDLDEIMSLTLRQVLSLLGADSGSVFLADAESDTFRRRAGWGQRSSDRTKVSEIQFHEGFGDLVTRSRTEVLTAEYLPHLPKTVADFIRPDGQGSWIWVLLWSKDRPVGIMGIGSADNREYSSNDENLLVAVGRQLATTIEKVRLYEETCRAYEDLRLTQEKLLQSEKMSAVGQLISGVAHELNNPLTAILGYTQLLESEKLEPRIEEFIQKLRKQAQRTQRIVQNLLSFARQHKPQRVHVDLRSVIEDTIALRDYDLKVNNIGVERDFEAVLPSVVADPHQLEQVYLNIINNAADAMMEGGRGGRLRVSIATENGSVVTSFHDSGPGIYDPKHVFDPFYTTKRVGKGTGLGLSICYGIVKEHGGEISAQNHPAGGALLQVRLPVAAGEKPVTERERIVARRESRLEGNVLLVNDEEAVLDFEREVLSAAGLQVVTVSSGAEAVESLKNEDFDILLLDSKIPGTWSSEQVFQWLQQNRPELVPRTVFVLSDVSDLGVRAFVDSTKTFCLVKPFEVPDLLAVVRRALRRVRAASAAH